MTSPFGVVHLAKTEYRPGKYAPATELTPKQREKARSLRDERAYYLRHDPGARRLRLAEAGEMSFPHGHDSIYSNHAFGMGENGAASYIQAKATPSAVHPNIHYGPTVGPPLRASLDRQLDPKATSALRHPVVFHHGDLPDPIHAGAVGAHRVTGNRGHVLLSNASVSSHGESLIPNVNTTQLIHHELAHAAKRDKNPRSLLTRPNPQRASVGEEARADAVGVKGKGVYQRTGVMPKRRLTLRALNEPKKLARQQFRNFGMDPKDLPKEAWHAAVKQTRAAGKLASRYHEVRSLVRAARFGKSAFGVIHA